MAHIDKSKCKNCGACSKVCPYTAIVNRKRPCENACKIKAITMNEDKAAAIDNKKCIACGACVYQCPFGAIMDKSFILDVVDLIKKSDNNQKYKVYAVVAPAISSQFSYAKLGQVITGLKELGFHTVVEAALGADMVADAESRELAEKGFLTSSCCPAFVSYIEKSFPQMLPFVSHNLSPMATIAKYLKAHEENCKVVFIGPCVAKKTEQVEGGPDYVLTTEEIVAMMDARKIDPDKMEADPVQESSTYGKGFASSGGVTSAVMQVIQEMGEVPQVSAQRCNGAAECKKALMMLQAGKFDMDFIEGMACEGGCMYGPGNLLNERLYTQARKKFLGEADDRGVIENAKEQGFDQIHMHR